MKVGFEPTKGLEAKCALRGQTPASPLMTAHSATTVGCVKEALFGKSRCIDCEVEANLPSLYAELEGLTQKGK